MIRTIARTLMAAIFIVGGWDSIQNPKTKKNAGEEASPMAAKLGLPTTDPEELVKMNGMVQLAGGILLAAGWLPRVAALALGASLVPTTLTTHRFWEIRDPEQRRAQMMHALKNGSILGGLIITSLDRGGRPSVFWSTRKAAERAGNAVSRSVEKVAS